MVCIDVENPQGAHRGFSGRHDRRLVRSLVRKWSWSVKCSTSKPKVDSLNVVIIGTTLVCHQLAFDLFDLGSN